MGLYNREQKLVADSIIGQKLNVRDTETLIKKIKDKNTTKPEALLRKLSLLLFNALLLFF